MNGHVIMESATASIADGDSDGVLLFFITTTRGVATGVDIGIYTPKKSAQVNFLWGKMT